MAGAESSSAPAGPHYGPIVVSAHIQASANIDVSSAIRCTAAGKRSSGTRYPESTADTPNHASKRLVALST